MNLPNFTSSKRASFSSSSYLDLETLKPQKTQKFSSKAKEENENRKKSKKKKQKTEQMLNIPPSDWTPIVDLLFR